jgi:hypothetical protein
MVQLTPCDYWVIAEHEGDYWCEDSVGAESTTHQWKFKGITPPPQPTISYKDWLKGIEQPEQPEISYKDWLKGIEPPEQPAISYKDWLKGIEPPEQPAISYKDRLKWHKLILVAPTNESESLDEAFSNEQEQIFGNLETDGAGVTHCGVLNLTGNTMLLTEHNITCPAQTEKDEYGVERYWPAINMGKYDRTQTYIHFCLFCLMVLIDMGDFNLLLWLNEI